MTQDEIARDKAAIAELIARYNYAIDHNDYQGWANTFAPDGVFQGVIGRFHAHKELDKFIASVKSLTDKSPNLRHYVTNILPEITGHEARCTSFLLMTSTTKGGVSTIALAGEYEDRLVKINGQWLFQQRIVRADGV
ncbi:MAG: nuclear transport factor 2 family protein [Deltaproteobacteria bacterium]|nr:nuclear transport factor 2 family protein [Deltaproteobacteria bacterium]